LVLLTTKAATAHLHFSFLPNDVLLAGRETTGAPEHVHRAADERIKVPMRAGLRSLNVAVAVAMVLGEALRQTGGFPRE
jgi:tRNA (cytidine/uridine-2'-O-)-methyltransferase